MKKAITIGIVVILTLCPIIGYIISPDVAEITYSTLENKLFNSIPPIRIDGEGALGDYAKTVNWPGTGDPDSPYIIEGYNINGTGYGYCIYIGNTSSKFIIRNCSLNNASGYDHAPFFRNAGIILYNTVGAEVQRNSITENEFGIFLENSYENQILENNIINNLNGIGEIDSGLNVFRFNNIESNSEKGMALESTHNDEICNNTFNENRFGIYLFRSTPQIINSSFTYNDYGLYARYSGTDIIDCVFEENDYGTYFWGEYSKIEEDEFEFNFKEKYFTSLGGTLEGKTSTMIPKNAEIKSSTVRLEGLGINNEPMGVESTLQMMPSIHEDMVVWQDKIDGNWEIYAYDMSTDDDDDGVPNYLEVPAIENDDVIRITNNPDTQACPKINEHTVVWTDTRGSNYNIYAYSFENSTEWAVCEDVSVQRNPAIYGDKIVWEDYRNGNYDIYMLNVSRGEVSRLSTSPRHDMGAEIYENYVTWYSYSGSPGASEYSDIVLFDLNKWVLKNVTSDKTALQYSPDIHKDSIVWHDSRHDNWEIYRYDISTETETRVTNNKEESFCPKIYDDKVVYYYHERNTGHWSVKMFDLRQKIQYTIEDMAYGDSHPVIYGDRVVWMNRSNLQSILFVTDYSIMGYPSDMKIDLGDDGQYELETYGLLNDTLYLNETLTEWIIDEQKSDTFRGKIPFKVSFDNAGTIICSDLSIKYEVENNIIQSSFVKNKLSGTSIVTSSPSIINSSYDMNNLDIEISSLSCPIIINSSFTKSKIFFTDDYGKLTEKNYLHLNATDSYETPINATATIDVESNIVFNNWLGADGEVKWVLINASKYSKSGEEKTKAHVHLEYMNFQFINNNRDVDMSMSHWEYFEADTTIPEFIMPYPIPNSYYNASDPVISVHIIDDCKICLNQVTFYVQGSLVNYNYERIDGGFNISYYNPSGYSNGESVRCRIVNENCQGLIISFNWTFEINLESILFEKNLSIGWNMISIPLKLYSSSLEDVFSSISGSYDTIMSYDTQDLENNWKSYRTDRQEAQNEISEINSIKGYWINITEQCTFRLFGLASQHSIPLYSGWNLVGYPSLERNITLSNALWGTGVDRVEGYGPLSPYMIKSLSPDHIMQPGEAYWLHAPVDSFWIIDWIETR